MSMLGLRSSNFIIILLWALLAPAFACASMALTGAGSNGAGTGTANVSFVHASGMGANTSTPVTSLAAPALSVSSGDTMCMSVIMFGVDVTGSVTAVKDDLLNSFTKEAEAGPSASTSQTYDYIWCLFNATSGSRTVTATFDNTKCPSNQCTFDQVWVVEFTGGAHAVDGTPTGIYHGSQSSPATGTAITTSFANSMMYELGSVGSGTMGAFGSFTAAASTGNATIQDYYLSLGSAGSYTPEYTMTTTDYANVLAVALH